MMEIKMPQPQKSVLSAPRAVESNKPAPRAQKRRRWELVVGRFLNLFSLLKTKKFFFYRRESDQFAHRHEIERSRAQIDYFKHF